MAKITITGDAMVVTSALTLNQIRTAEKARPKALCLMDEEKNMIFKVMCGSGDISKYGASFASEAHDGTGKATITMMIPSGVEDVKEYAEEKIGVAILNLNRVEAQVIAIMPEIQAEVEAVRAAIEITGEEVPETAQN